MHWRIHLEVDYASTTLRSGRATRRWLATGLLWWLDSRRAAEYLAVGAGDRACDAGAAGALRQLRLSTANRLANLPPRVSDPGLHSSFFPGSIRRSAADAPAKRVDCDVLYCGTVYRLGCPRNMEGVRS